MKCHYLTTLSIALMTSPALASFTTVTHQDLTDCDTLGPLPSIMDELGTGAFPANELISATFSQTQLDACPLNSNGNIPNIILNITNLTNLSFTDLHYVADPSTTFSNFDGLINGALSVVIDNVGVNRPLIAEIGGSLPLVFEPGETWRFILDDWGSVAGIAPADLGSIGVPSGVPGGLSTGSIVAIPVPVPEPASLALVGLGVTALIKRK